MNAGTNYTGWAKDVVFSVGIRYGKTITIMMAGETKVGERNGRFTVVCPGGSG
jgi:hypothetical protein